MVLSQWLILAVSLVFLPQQPRSEPVDKGVPKEKTTSPNQPDLAEIKKLIQQLGSSNFSDREMATNRLISIGKPALTALREAAKNSNDPEIRRRAGQLAEKWDEDPLFSLFTEGVGEEKKKNYKKADDVFDKAIKLGLERYQPGGKAPPGDIPLLTEIFVHSARIARELGDFEKAGRAYHQACYYSNSNNIKRKEIDHEWSEMADLLMSGWEDTVKAKTSNDPILKKRVSEYQLVLLHSRRYAGGRYLRSTYSFLYETADESKHFNDVQLQFDNGRRDNTFTINMVTNQENRIADLGKSDFTKDPDAEKLEKDRQTRWLSADCKAIEGHVYLEQVRESRGNNFFVLFQVVAVDKDSNFVAFVWRRLPGGTVVKQR